MRVPVRIHPDNPKIFQFRGNPLVFITATEHYGAVINRRFCFERYLTDAAEKGMTLTRLFVLYRELQTTWNPCSTLKPGPGDFVAPFQRVGPGTLSDGQPRFDLDQWNPQFFDRLHRFLSLASEYDIIVEVTLFSNTYGPDVWALNPLFHENNINALEQIEWPDYLSMRHPRLFERQVAHARKIVEETKRYDNIVYEICNEPGGAVAGSAANPSPDEVDAWQAAIAGIVREAEADLPAKHLVCGQSAAHCGGPWEQPLDRSFDDPVFDIVNLHPGDCIIFEGKSFNMSRFTAKDLALRALREGCLATYVRPKPLNVDEDNAASQYRDFDGWTIHRKRAWTALLSGAHYDMIDFSINPYCETGTADSQCSIRSWMKYLSEFIHSIDLVRARPLGNWLRARPEHILESVFAVDNQDYCIYLADMRELNEPGQGEPIDGEIVLDLPAGEYGVASYSPVSGLYSPALPLTGGAGIHLALPPFVHDILIRVRRKV